MILTINNEVNITYSHGPAITISIDKNVIKQFGQLSA